MRGSAPSYYETAIGNNNTTAKPIDSSQLYKIGDRCVKLWQRHIPTVKDEPMSNGLKEWRCRLDEMETVTAAGDDFEIERCWINFAWVIVAVGQEICRQRLNVRKKGTCATATGDVSNQLPFRSTIITRKIAAN